MSWFLWTRNCRLCIVLVDFCVGMLWLQEAIKCMRHSKRTTLTADDVESALKLRNVEVNFFNYDFVLYLLLFFCLFLSLWCFLVLTIWKVDTWYMLCSYGPYGWFRILGYLSCFGWSYVLPKLVSTLVNVRYVTEIWCNVILKKFFQFGDTKWSQSFSYLFLDIFVWRRKSVGMNSKYREWSFCRTKCNTVGHKWPRKVFTWIIIKMKLSFIVHLLLWRSTFNHTL